MLTHCSGVLCKCDGFIFYLMRVEGVVHLSASRTIVQHIRTDCRRSPRASMSRAPQRQPPGDEARLDRCGWFLKYNILQTITGSCVCLRSRVDWRYRLKILTLQLCFNVHVPSQKGYDFSMGNKQKVDSYQKRGIKRAEPVASPGSGWLPLGGGRLVRKRGGKGVLVLYNFVSDV